MLSLPKVLHKVNIYPQFWGKLIDNHRDTVEDEHKT